MSERVTPELQLAVERFLYQEAMFLDGRDFDQWFALIADDICYRAPVRRTQNERELDMEFSAPNEVSHFDETKASLKMRLRRLKTGQAWAENPPSRTRHCVSNVFLSPRENGDLGVESVMIVYRTRGDRQIDWFVGGRIDVLRRVDDQRQFEIVERTIHLDQTLLHANNISIFL